MPDPACHHSFGSLGLLRFTATPGTADSIRPFSAPRTETRAGIVLSLLASFSIKMSFDLSFAV